MKKYVMLCKKHITTFKEDGKTIDKEFDTFFGYRQVMNTDGSFTDVMTPFVKEDGSSIMVAKAIKVALGKEMFERVKDLKFPIRVTLDDELILEEDRPSFYVCINKDKENKVIKDKNGKKHYILVIRAMVDYTEVETTPVTLDNFDDFE